MKIGLIGAPGSGKSNLALELVARVEGLSDGYVILDGYTDLVEERYDFALDFGGSYVANLAVAIERLGCERRADRTETVNHRITCGTLLETSVYEAIQAFSSENEAVIWRAYNAMQVFASLFVDAWDYDIVLYLPGSADNDVAKAVRAEIPLTIEKTGLEAVELSACCVADEAVKAVQEKHAELAVQS